MLTASCSRIPQAEPPTAQSPTTTTTATTSTAKTTPTSVPKVTAACPLLSAGELKAFLGINADDTRITATEEAPHTFEGHAVYGCDYGSNGSYPFQLGVVTVPEAQSTPQAAIDAIGKSSKVSTHPVTGVGEAALFFTRPDGLSVLAASKRSQGEVRTVVFTAPAELPEHEFAVVTILPIGRL